MPKYKKIPVTIEAFQMTKERRWNNFDWPQWLHEAWNTDGEGSLYCIDGGEELFIGTLEGSMSVSFGDYIIKGVHGEIYPCKPDIFHKTYEEDTDCCEAEGCYDDLDLDCYDENGLYFCHSCFNERS